MSGVGATVAELAEAAGVSMFNGAYGYARRVNVFTQGLSESEACLAVVRTMSHANASSGEGFYAPAWLIALGSWMRGTASTNAWKRSNVGDLCAAFGVEPDTVEWVPPSRKDEAPRRVYAGDRPKGRVNGAGDIAPYPRAVQSIDALAKALWWREDAVESELSRIDPTPSLQVRRTHRAIHEALAGGSVRGGTGGLGCKWCEEGRP